MFYAIRLLGAILATQSVISIGGAKKINKETQTEDNFFNKSIENYQNIKNTTTKIKDIGEEIYSNRKLIILLYLTSKIIK